ncbi:MAG: ABC transporter ATP-binding protein [Planctomycetota bacterium]
MSASLFHAEAVSKHFGGLKALERVDLSVERGSIHSVIGPNGAGKTTLFNCITGIHPPTAGRIFLEERDITGLPSYRVTRLGLARTFQNIRLFKQMTALENVMVGRHPRTRAGWFSAILRMPARPEERAIERQAMEILDFVGLRDRAGVWARNLAYGDQRRLEIARALATEPRVLLLDEPAAGMNPGETSRLMDLIREIRDRGPTVILIEHDMKVVMGVSDRVTVIDYGRKIAEGTPDEVKADRKVIAAYLGVPEEEE